MSGRKHVGGRNLLHATVVGAALLVLAAVALIWSSDLFVLIVLAVVAAAYLDMDRVIRHTASPVISVSLVAAGVLLAGTHLFGFSGQVGGIVTLLGATVAWLLAKDVTQERLARATATVFAGVWILLFASFALIILQHSDGEQRLAVTIGVVALADIGGYAIGVPFGRHKLSARLSPNKTVEGVLGAVTVATAGAAFVWPWLFDQPVWHGIAFGFVVAVACIVGDIAESGVKRALDVKDLGSLLPGHGGVLDRVDGLLFALPVATLVFTLI